MAEVDKTMVGADLFGDGCCPLRCLLAGVVSGQVSSVEQPGANLLRTSRYILLIPQNIPQLIQHGSLLFLPNLLHKKSTHIVDDQGNSS